MLVDCHVHSTCSGDCPIPMQDMCAQAVALGIGTIAFTEHYDNNPLDMCCGMYSLDFHRSEIEATREAFASRLDILAGVEFGEPHSFPEQCRDAQTWDLDVILGSVHWVGDIIVAVDEFAGSDMEALYSGYFDEVLKAVEFGGFDVLAHFDLIKRFGVKYNGPFEMRKHEDQIAAVLEAMIRQEIALEVNTSGLRQPCRETMPGAEIIRLYRDLGGELITIGSDSHRIQQLGFGLGDALALIHDAGFSHINVYRNRKPEVVALG